MPWSEACTMDLRIAFIDDCQTNHDVTGACRRAGISRKTGYKWLERYRALGESGLADASRRPLTSPQATANEVRAAILELRRSHPTWGAKKLLVKLAWSSPHLALPSVATASRILDRAGLVERRRRCRRLPRTGGAWPRGDRPNAIWCTDFKGQFRTLDGRWCYPLTVMDEHSRFILRCESCPRIDGDAVRRSFTGLFRRHGLPEAIRSDNGCPFASTGLSRLSRLSVWWLRLGIALRRNAPAHPQHNGRHERMHRDLKAETTRPPASDLRRQQRLFDRFVDVHNHERPHEALGQRPPASEYVASRRPYPERLTEPEYPSHYEVRRVAPNGAVSLWGGYVFLSHALVGERVGLIERDEDAWTVYLGDLAVGVIDRRTRRVRATDNASSTHPEVSPMS